MGLDALFWSLLQVHVSLAPVKFFPHCPHMLSSTGAAAFDGSSSQVHVSQRPLKLFPHRPHSLPSMMMGPLTTPMST